MKKLLPLVIILITLNMQGQTNKWPQVKNLHPNKNVRWVTMKSMLAADLIDAKIVVKPLAENREEHAYVTKAGSFYVIYMKEDLNNFEEVIRHELIHVKQMENGDLIQQKDGWIWKGKFYANTTKYNHRPWEHDAHKNDSYLAFKNHN